MTSEEMAVHLAEHGKEIGSLKHRMDECEKDKEQLFGIVKSIERLAVNMEHMAHEQQKQGERLEALEHEPIDAFKHYKRLVIGCIITTVLGALIGAGIALILK